MTYNNKPIFEWDEEIGSALCILTDGETTFVGIAQCSDEDNDMKSEKTGCTIALLRAEIKYYLHLKNNVFKPQLKALNQLYYSINKSKKFNEKSYENRMLQRQIRQQEYDLYLINEMLKDKKDYLKNYIQSKNEFYLKIRKNRNKNS